MVWVSEQKENDKRLRCCCSTSITFIISISPQKISTTVLLSQPTMPSASSQKQIPLRHCVVSSLSHSKVQSTSMYSDEPIFQITHHHQPPHSLPPFQVATSLWPSQTSNYWFPNWRELFHGFIVMPSSQPRHATVSSFAQNQVAACTPYSASSCTQYLHLGTDDPTQFTHHGARSAQLQQITSPLPSSSAHTPLSHFPDVTRLPRPSGEESHTAAQSPTPVDQTQKRDEHVVCLPSSQALGPITKYTIKSPFWLPQGWVTEMRMRSTGTAADKFYKHLASGRRFRSRNEVLHFIHTGKGRTRKKQSRRKKSLNLSLMNNFAHKKHTAFAASKLVSSQSLPSSSSENRHHIHVGNPLLTDPGAEPGPNGESAPPTKQHISFSANSGIQEPESLQLQLPKRPAHNESQKLPVQKKQKTLPLNAGDDKQTSNLWHWVKQPDTEAKASEMAEQRNENDSSSKDTASQKTEQLGREIQAAHKTVVQMSKEMQATVEKLSRQIREAQKDVELASDLKLTGVPAEIQVASIYKADTGKICRDTPATPRENMMPGGIVQASHGLPIAANNHTGRSESIAGFVSDNVQKRDNMKGFPKQEDPRPNVSPQATNFVSNALSVERSFVTDSMSQAIQPAIWPDITSHQVIRMDYGSHVAKRYVDTSNQATQSAETALVTTVNVMQAAGLHAAAPIHVMRATVGDVTLPTLWPGFSALPVVQPTQIASIAHVKAADKCGSVEDQLPQCAATAHFEASNRTQMPQRHVDMGGHHAAKQPAQVDCVGIANVAQSVRTQMVVVGPPLPTTERPVYSIGNADAPLYNPVIANPSSNVVPQQAAGDGRSEQWHAAQVSVSCEMATTEEVWRQKYQDIKERSIRRNKFAAVLNPKLDLSRLNPALTARQKAKVVQRMKNRHARELLATLGLHLCRKAIRRKPWPSCTSRDEI